MGRLTAIVLGAAAGGGFPQWNCRCPVCRLAWAGDPRVHPRTQTSVAVSGDGERWLLLNASPDLRAQIIANPALHPRGKLRASPIEAVLLTGGEIDQTAGLLTLRERQPFTLFATAETLCALAGNPMFAALDPDVVARKAIAPGQRVDVAGLTAEIFTVPGKVPLYLEDANPKVSESGANIGVEISDGASRLFFIPGAAAVTDALRARLQGADVILFDGTLYSDDEMIARRHRRQNRIAHGPHADRRPERLARGIGGSSGAPYPHSCQQHQPDPDRGIAAAPSRRGRGFRSRVDGMEIVA